MKSGRQALPRGWPEFYKVARVLGNLDGDGNLDDGDEIIHTSVFLLILVNQLFVVLVASFLGVKVSRQRQKDRNVDGNVHLVWIAAGISLSGIDPLGFRLREHTH